MRVVRSKCPIPGLRLPLKGTQTFDKGVVGVQRCEVIALFDRKLAPLELAAHRIPVVQDEDVLFRALNS